MGVTSSSTKWGPWLIIIITRMHSSRMRTGRSLTVCRSLLPGGGGGVPAQGGTCPGGCTCPEGVVPARRGVYLPGGVPARGVYLPRGVPAQRGGTCPGGVYVPRGSAPGGALRQTPPCEQNHTRL